MTKMIVSSKPGESSSASHITKDSIMPRLVLAKFARMLWKEIFEFRSRPAILLAILALSLGATLAAGNLNTKDSDRTV
jgi:predicted permease